jgi:hypothetical protein
MNRHCYAGLESRTLGVGENLDGGLFVLSAEVDVLDRVKALSNVRLHRLRTKPTLRAYRGRLLMKNSTPL